MAGSLLAGAFVNWQDQQRAQRQGTKKAANQSITLDSTIGKGCGARTNNLHDDFRLPATLLKVDRQGHLQAASGLPTVALNEWTRWANNPESLIQSIHLHDRPAFLKALNECLHKDEKKDVRVRLREPLELAAVKPYRFIMQAWSDESAQVLMLEATAEAAHENRLEELRETLARSQQSQSQFLGVMSHELRTPLNAIIGFADMLGQAKALNLSDQQTQEYTEIIRSSGEHLMSVIESLLDIAKLESGTFAIQQEPFRMETVVQSVLKLLQFRFEGAQVTSHVVMDPTVPDLVADQRACRQILINLLSNALKFTPKGGAISIRTARRGKMMEIAVEDTGCGIAPEDVARLGQPFFQASSGYARAAEGTGLGLAIVKGLVSLHKGHFEVKSTLGEGTCISVRLPLKGLEGEKSEAAETVFDIKPRWTPEPLDMKPDVGARVTLNHLQDSLPKEQDPTSKEKKRA